MHLTPLIDCIYNDIVAKRHTQAQPTQRRVMITAEGMAQKSCQPTSAEEFAMRLCDTFRPDGQWCDTLSHHLRHRVPPNDPVANLLAQEPFRNQVSARVVEMLRRPGYNIGVVFEQHTGGQHRPETTVWTVVITETNGGTWYHARRDARAD